MNTNTDLKCMSIDLLQLKTLWNNVINTIPDSVEMGKRNKFHRNLFRGTLVSCEICSPVKAKDRNYSDILFLSNNSLRIIMYKCR